MAASLILEHHYVLVAVILVALFLVSRRRTRKTLGLPLPPGPRPLPLIGNLLDIPTKFEWITYAEWSRKYNSDIVHHEFAGTSTIILNSQKAISDLLEKKSNMYSSRPKWIMLNELIGWDWNFINMPYGKEWNTRRKLFTNEFNPKQTERYEPQTLKVVRIFLLDLLRDPEDFYHLLRHMAGSAILSMTYGLSIKPAEVGDPIIDMAERALYGYTAAAVPGIFWVDYLPKLKYVPSWFPGASFKRKARGWAKDAEGMLNGPYDSVKADRSKGIVHPSFVSYCLEKNIQSTTKELINEESAVREAAGAMYVAGTDTTVAALNTFILAVVCHPEVQRKAQEEIDRVVGPGRLPDFEDRESLPYIQAIVYEVMRYQPVTPLSLAHLVTEEDEYEGYRIPKDSVVIGNTWALLHDEATYGPHPEAFDPNRFLTPDGKLNPAIPEPISFFGFGRRICPGRHLALSTLFAAIASVLHSFELSETEALTHEYESCLQNRPVPFKCGIKPRSAKHAELIQSAAQFTIIDER